MKLVVIISSTNMNQIEIVVLKDTFFRLIIFEIKILIVLIHTSIKTKRIKMRLW